MVANKLEQIFTQVPDVIYGYTDISYSSLSEEYKSALVFAVPHEERLDLGSYTEESFENCILTARKSVESILRNIEVILNDEHIKYYIPPMAQQNEEELLAIFSFKYAAVNAGLEWNIDSLRNDLIDYHLCNQKRSTYIEKYGRKNACGLCMVVCPYGMEKL